MTSKRTIYITALLIVCLIIGAVLITIDGKGNWLTGWLADSFLLLAGAGIMLLAWRWGGGGKTLAWMMTLAFVLRIGVGFGMEKALPLIGNDTPSQKAGYIFYDSYRRDGQSWGLADSNQPVWMAYSEDITADQYGGMLLVSALIYRYLSPDAHRAWFILILTSTFAAIGVPFLLQTGKRLWGGKTGNIAAWILALYPESILLGASQMREPILISLIAIAFWAVVVWQQEKQRRYLIWLGLALAGMIFISWRVAAPTIAVLLGWVWFSQESLKPDSKVKVLGWIGFVLAGLALVFLSWHWFQSAAEWDALLTKRASGWVQYLLHRMDENLYIPFITVLGVAQVVLPAAIIEPSIAIWRSVAILRSLGWYLLAPLLIYGFISAWRVENRREKRLLVYLGIVVWVWILVSSARAGGDLWDNPRYRALFLVWQAIVAGWAIAWAIRKKDPWLARWLVVEAIFLAFFTVWYANRYYAVAIKIPFWTMVEWIIGLSCLVLIGGWVWDKLQHKKRA